MKKKIEFNFWLLAAFCFIISGIFSRNMTYTILGFSYICLGFCYPEKK